MEIVILLYVLLHFFKLPKDWNGHFSKKDIKMTNKYIKGFSVWLVIREMQVRMAIIEQTDGGTRG
jgi:hypothetical protein